MPVIGDLVHTKVSKCDELRSVSAGLCIFFLGEKHTHTRPFPHACPKQINRARQIRKRSGIIAFFQRGRNQKVHSNSPRVGAVRATLVQDAQLQQLLESATTSLLRSEASTESVNKRRSVRFFLRGGHRSPHRERYQIPTVLSIDTRTSAPPYADDLNT